MTQIFKAQKLALLAASAACIFAVSLVSGCSKDNTNDSVPEKQNLVFFLGDGMGIVPTTAGRTYAVGESGSLTIDTLPETAFVRTYSNDAQVTDSAPSMAAYMTGVKMNNEVLSMTPDTKAVDASGKPYVSGSDSTCPATGNGSAVQTILELYKKAGRGTGVVTTTRITHATPAATYAHLCHRDGENNIAAQLVPGGAGYNGALDDGVDVLFGGGFRHFSPMGSTGTKRNDSRDLFAELTAKNYKTIGKSDAAAFRALDPASTGKVIALFTDSHMSYDLERDNAKEPSLAEMTTKAIAILGQAKNEGFFLMVEGGRIDHGLHETRAKRALGDLVAFDNAVKAGLDKLNALDPGLKHTLVVVTADHDHTMLLNGYAALTGPTTASSAGILGLMRNFADGSIAKDADGKPFTTIGFGNGNNRPARTHDGAGVLTASEPDISDAITNTTTYQSAATVQCDNSFGDDCESHGGADVFLGATGKNATDFHGVFTNTEIFALLKKAAGL